jgi:hypothetical protein
MLHKVDRLRLRVRVRVGTRVSVCACARVALLIRNATRMRHIVGVLCGSTVFFDIIA